MALYKNELVDKVNRNFRYSWIYLLISIVVSLYYLGFILWVLSANNWEFNVAQADQMIKKFTEEHNEANIIMIIYLVLNIIQLITFVLLFVLIFVNSIRIAFAGDVAPTGTKVWAVFNLFIYAIIFTSFILTIIDIWSPDILGEMHKYLVYLKAFNMFLPLLLFMTTGFCKICTKKVAK